MTDLLPASKDLAAFVPELLLVLAMAGALLAPMVMRKRNLLATPVLATVGLGAAWLSLFLVRGLAIGAPRAYLGGMLLLDPFSWALKFLLIGFALIVMALWFTDSHDKFITRGQTHDTPEFFAMLLAATLGLCLLVDTANLLVLFIAMEATAFPIAVLVAFRKGHRPGASAGMKFLILGAAASAITVYGMSLLYGVFGSLDLRQIGALAAGKEGHLQMGAMAGVMLAMGLVGILAGVGFKAALAPAHFWGPDVFEGASIDVTTFIAVASVTAGLAVLLRIAATLSAAAENLWWIAPALLVLGAITSLGGSLGALWQTNIKRLLAWSGITHAGFMVLGMTAVMLPARSFFAGDGPRPAELFASPAAEMLLFYLLMFLFMTGGAFIAAAAIAQRLTGPADAGMSLGVDKVIAAIPSRPPLPEHETGEDILQYAGLWRRAPILAAIMLVFLLSLAGVPLTIGFAAKIKLLSVLFNISGPLGWIAIAVAVLATVILACSYFRVVHQMYLVDSDLPRLIEIAPVTVVALVLVVPNIVLLAGYTLVNNQARQHAAMLAAPSPPAPPPSPAAP